MKIHISNTQQIFFPELSLHLFQTLIHAVNAVLGLTGGCGQMLALAKREKVSSFFGPITGVHEWMATVVLYGSVDPVEVARLRGVLDTHEAALKEAGLFVYVECVKESLQAVIDCAERVDPLQFGSLIPLTCGHNGNLPEQDMAKLGLCVEKAGW